MDYLCERLPRNIVYYEVVPYIYKDIISAVRENRLDILKAGSFNATEDDISMAILVAACDDNVECLEWLYEYLLNLGPADDYLKFLYKHSMGGDLVSGDASLLAAKYSSLKCLKWLHEHNRLKHRTALIQVAAEHGNLDCLTWLHDIGGRSSKEAMIKAAENGHLLCLIYLFHSGAECTPKVIIAAAANGHLDCVKWLCEHNAPLSSKALSEAATKGHLAVVQYLIDKLL